jgi:hypothetical protein
LHACIHAYIYASIEVQPGYVCGHEWVCLEKSGMQEYIVLSPQRTNFHTTHIFPFGISFLSTSSNPHLLAYAEIDPTVLSPKLESLALI